MHTKAKIKNMAVCDQPREKLIHKGAASLTNTEILAIILRSGTHEESVIELSEHIMKDCDNSFMKLSQLSVEELVNNYKGIGQTKAIQIVATSEMTKRSKYEQVTGDTVIRSSQEVYNRMAPFVAPLEHEEFWVLFLNRANKVISQKKISQGGFSGTVTDIRIIFRLALEKRATSIIICHNHPSGNTQPSSADRKITARIAEAGKTMDINLLDHIIVAGENYYGFADNGDL